MHSATSPHSADSQPCDLGQVPSPRWARVSLSGNEDTRSSRRITCVTHARGPQPGVEKRWLSSPDFPLKAKRRVTLSQVDCRGSGKTRACVQVLTPVIAV